MIESCPLCAAERSHITHELTGYRIARCGACGFEYQPGFRGGGGADGVFSQDYYQVLQQEAFQAQFEDYALDPSAPVFRRWLEAIERRVPRGRILDVGSALGTFLRIAADRGWAEQGVEISRFAAEFAREKRGLSVFNGDLESYPGEEGSFDVVTFWDSMEHVTHPRENLAKAVRLLRPGGLMLLATDNYDCLLCDVARSAYRASFGAIRYPMERVFIAPNRSYFTERTFRRFLEDGGLRIVGFEKMEYPLEKIKAGAAERLVLRAFYGAARLLNRQAQMTVLAEKP
jgi:2-polyprenyl-3-methyl-5-hydroxy-6-metoxy-1,4-benzoquinol methylase